MSRKDYVKIADAIKHHNKIFPTNVFTTNQLITLAEVFAADNPLFKRERFLDYVAGTRGTR